MSVYRDLFQGVPYVAATHNVESDLIRDCARSAGGLTGRLTRRDGEILAREEGRFVAASRLAVAVSDDDAARLRVLAPGARVVTIANGVDTEAFRVLPPPPATGPLLFVGSFDYPPNVDAAIHFVREQLPAIRARIGDVPVVLAGRDAGPSIRELGQTPGVTVTGRVPDLVPLYRDASAVIVPLRLGGGTRLKILEAFALGRPVIATAVGASGLGVEHERELLIADDAEGMARAILRLRSDHALGSTLVERARAFVESSHGWRALGAAFAAAVEQACASTSEGGS